LYADYSDPDVIRDGDDYYLIAASFEFVPGLPVLHSRDLVHWQILGHILPRLRLGAATTCRARCGTAGGVGTLRSHPQRLVLHLPSYSG